MATLRAKRVAAAATDAAPDGKKSKQRGFVMTLTVPAPENVTPVPLELVNQHKSKSAARKAKAAATRVERYCYSDFSKFATPFAAAIASASAKKGRPVTLVEVITEMTDMTDCEPKFDDKKLKGKWCWDGFVRELWQISRDVPPQGLVPFPKGTARPSDSSKCKWRFFPSPAARRPLAVSSCEPSSRPSAGCVVC